MSTAPRDPALPACAHHWVLGQAAYGLIPARCRKCGRERAYPAVLDDLDPGIEVETRQLPGVATAVGGARPSSVAAPSGEPAARLLADPGS